MPLTRIRTFLGSFRFRYKINIQALTRSQRLFYFGLVRPLTPRSDHIWFEGVPGVAGHLHRAERRALHDAVLQRKPSFAYEVGTFNGGGSTFFQARALAQLGHGKVVTLECDPSLHAEAVDLYTRRLPELRPHVEFLFGSDPALFEPFLRAAGSAEFVFLDGAEDAAQSLQQFRFFEPWFRRGSVLALHDWHTEKMRLLRHELGEVNGWSTLDAVDPPHGLGLMIKVRR